MFSSRRDVPADALRRGLRSFDPFRFLLIAVAGWMNQEQRQIVDYLREENRVLRPSQGLEAASFEGRCYDRDAGNPVALASQASR